MSMTTTELKDISRLAEALGAEYQVEPLNWMGPFLVPAEETRAFLVIPEDEETAAKPVKLSVQGLLYVMRSTERELWRGAFTMMYMTALAHAGQWPPQDPGWAKVIPSFS